ncbi:MAG: hypothetical protein ACOCJN_02385 [Spirochaetaceae bacterium JB067]
MKSKKRLLPIFLILLMFSLSSVFSYPVSLALDMLNDGISFGIGDNPDDLRSYGASVSIETPSKWIGNIELTGFTLRNNEDSSLGRRFDEILVSGGKEFSLSTRLLPNILIYTASIQGGVALAGNLGFSTVQNVWHEMNGIETVHLAYCSGGNIIVHPYIPISHSISVLAPLSFYSSTELVFRIDNDIFFSPGYRSGISAALTLGHVTSYDKHFTVSLGIADYDVLNSWPLHSVVTDSESGPFFKIDGRMGMIDVFYQYHFTSYKGYGGIGLNLGFDDQDSHYYSSSDLILSLGFQPVTRMLNIRSRYAIDEGIGIYLSNTFKSRLLVYNENLRQIISKWHMGIDYQVRQLETGYLIPYASLGAGLKRIIVTADIPNTIGRRDVYADRLAFLMYGELGARFFHDGRFRVGSVSYGLEIAVGLGYSSTSHLQPLIDEYDLVLTDDLYPSFRIALFSAGSL